MNIRLNSATRWNSVRRSRSEHLRARRGVILMVVLGLLAMFMLIAVTFVLTSNAERDAAAASGTLELYGDPPDAMLNKAIYEIVRGSRNPISAIGPHSLLEDMYGNRETIVGAVAPGGNIAGVSLPPPVMVHPMPAQSASIAGNVNRDVLGQFIEFSVFTFGPDRLPGQANVDDGGAASYVDDPGEVGASGSDDLPLGVIPPYWDRVPMPSGPPYLDNMEGYYAGRTLTILDGPAKNETVRIVRYFYHPTKNAWRLLVTRPANGQPIVRGLSTGAVDPNEIVRVVINGRPFNGAGFGYNQQTSTGSLDLTYAKLAQMNGASIGSDAWTSWPLALTPNPAESSYREYLNRLFNTKGGVDAGVDADEDYDVADYQNMMLAAAIWSPEVYFDNTGSALSRKATSNAVGPRWKVRIPSLHRPDLVAFWMVQMGAAQTTPFARDGSWANILPGGSGTDPRLRQKFILRPDPQDHVSNPGTKWLPGAAEWSGNAFFDPVLGPWDVDNDNDGDPDSIWVDLGMPVQISEDGKPFKPLFAILCLDLDGRFNINVHGNWTHYIGRDPQQSTGAIGFDYAGSYVLGGAGAFGGMSLKSSYGADFYLLGGKYFGIQNRPVGTSTLYSYASDPTGAGVRLLNQFGMNGGPYAGATSSGGSDLSQYTNLGGTLTWSEIGQGFSVAEVNLGGVIPLPLILNGTPRAGYTQAQDLATYPPYQLNPYRILLEGNPTFAPTDFMARSAEGRYGERMQLPRRVGFSSLQNFSHLTPFFQNALVTTPGFARPGITLLDDNSPLPASPGGGLNSYGQGLGPGDGLLTWPQDPSNTSAQRYDFWYPMALRAEYATSNDVPFMNRGNRWTESSYLFTNLSPSITSGGNSSYLAMQAIGNYGFWCDPNGHTTLGLDMRGVPYAGNRAIPYPYGDSYQPNYFGYQYDLLGSSGGWQRGPSWLQTAESVDDPWELNVYINPKGSPAYGASGTGFPYRLDPFVRPFPMLEATGINDYPLGFNGTIALADARTMATFNADAPFTPGELEPFLRVYDQDLTRSNTRLGAILGYDDWYREDLTTIRRMLLTSDSWDVPSPNITPTPEIVQGLLSAGLPTTNLTFVDLLKGKILAAGGTANNVQAAVSRPATTTATNFYSQMVPNDLLMGLRLDINRPFGNAIDDNFNGVVDDSPPPGANLYCRYGPLNPPYPPTTGMAYGPNSGFVQSVTPFQASEMNILHSDAGNTNPNSQTSLNLVKSATDSGLGVPMQASNYVPSTTPPNTVKQRTATYSAANKWQPNTGAIDMSRQELAKHLYILAMLVNHLSPNANAYGFPAAADDTTLSLTDRQKLAAYRCAQWAVNAIDFRDRDAIMTPFEFDLSPFTDDDGNNDSPWDVDGLLSDIARGASAGDDSAAYRGLVWGMEAPELLITETMASHDKRVADTDKEQVTGGSMNHMMPGKTTDMPPKQDPDFDQVRIPQGTLMVELYCAAARQPAPNPFHPDIGLFPPELYDVVSNDPMRPEHAVPGTDLRSLTPVLQYSNQTERSAHVRSARYGLLDLSRLAPPTVNGGTSYRLPVWRLAITDWHQNVGGSNGISSVRDLLLRQGSSVYSPYKTSLAPTVFASDTPYNWMGSGPTGMLSDRISTDMLNPTSGTSIPLADGARFVWFVDRWSLDGEPPRNVFCYRSSDSDPGSTRDRLRFLLEPGHYAVVGPQRLDSNFKGTNAPNMQNFMTITAFSAYSNPPEQGSASSTGVSAPPWYPAWFCLSPRNNSNNVVPPIVNYIERYTMGGTPAQQPARYYYPYMISPGAVLSGNLAGSEIQAPVAIPTANYHPQSMTAGGLSLYPYSGLNISEPIQGYNESAAAFVGVTTMSPVVQTVYDDRGTSYTSTIYDGFDPNVFIPDSPYDGMPQGTHGSELFSVGMVTPGTYSDVKTVFLQRLANPLVAWDAVFNPYITVDWMPVDLTVYNGQFVWRSNWTTAATPAGIIQAPELNVGQMGQNVPSYPITNYMGTGSPAPNYQFNFASRQRGPNDWVEGSMHQLPLWPVMSSNPTVQYPYNNLAGAPDGVFRHDPYCSFGYLNGYYKTGAAVGSGGPINPRDGNDLAGLQSTVPPTVLVNYIGAPPYPYPWVTWLNRPFASQGELILVPASSPSRFTTEFTYVPPGNKSSTANNFPLIQQPHFYGTTSAAPNDPLSSQYRVYASVKSEDLLKAPFGHLLNFFASNASTSGLTPNPDTPDFHRLLEFVTVRSRFSGSEDFVIPYSPLDPGPASGVYDPVAEMFAPPYNRISKYREPGRVNLNTFTGASYDSTHRDATQVVSGAQHWGALVNFTPQHDDHWSMWCASRYSGMTPTTPPGIGFASATVVPVSGAWPDVTGGSSTPRFVLFDPRRPSIFANPLRSYTNGFRVAEFPPVGGPNQPTTSLRIRKDGATMHRYADASLLKWQDLGYDPAVNGEGMLTTWDRAYEASTNHTQQVHDANRNPYYRYQDYVKLGNVATTRSNVYAVWVTMGMFEVERLQTVNSQLPNYRDPATIGSSNPDGYRLVREKGIDSGDVKRNRAFMIVDRSVPVGFQRGENYNVDRAIKVRRVIE